MQITMGLNNCTVTKASEREREKEKKIRSEWNGYFYPVKHSLQADFELKYLVQFSAHINTHTLNCEQ